MENYTQLCVWPGATLGDQTPQEFEEFVLEMMGTRVRYHDTVETLPDLENGNPVPETGGRSDLFFYVHTDDIPHFSVPRLKIGIRWWEDVIVYNDNRHLYTE
jgi:hypothetical protein